MKRFLSFVVILLLVCFVAHARVVSGVVKGEGCGLQGVLVSDGLNFTKTSINGSYSLDIKDDARFVFVVTPSGWTATFDRGTSEFYKKVDRNISTYDFDLITTAVGSDYNLFAISDPQMQDRDQFALFKGEPISDIIEQSAKYSAIAPTVAVALGDVAWNNLELMPLYKEEVAKAKIPFYAVIGNHDHIQNVGGDAALAEFENNFGPVNWAFCIGNDVVIGLDNILFKASNEEDKSKSSEKYTEGYSQRELDFVKNLLANIPLGTHLYIAQHSPAFISVGEREIINYQPLMDLLKGYKVDFISGHTHYMANCQLTEDIREHNVASLCGTWWITRTCLDGTPRGYKIFTSNNGNITWKYHSVDYPDSMRTRVILPSQSEYHPNSVILNAWDFDKDWKITWSEDGVAKGEMLYENDLDPVYIEELVAAMGTTQTGGSKQPRPRPHYFVANPSPTAKYVKITVVDNFGRSWTHNINLIKNIVF